MTGPDDPPPDDPSHARASKGPDHETDDVHFLGDLYGELALAERGLPGAVGVPLVRYLPGIALCATIAIAASWLSEHYGMPAILMGLLMGLALNFGALDPRTHPGLDMIGRTGLRLGIVLIGLQVTLLQIVAIGVVPFLALLSIMAAAFGGGLAGARLSGQSREAGILAGGATAICGASAALALYGVIGKDRLPKAQFAVTLVGITLASALAMTAYPVIAGQLGLSDRAAGFLIGASVHDVAQAIGGGYSYSNAAGVEATIVKLTRVALLAPIVLLVSLWIGSGQENGGSVLKRISPPWFILAFLALVTINSLVAIPVALSQGADVAAQALLLMAVVATALRSRTDLIRALGWRAAMPVVAATLASFAAALLIVFLAVR